MRLSWFTILSALSILSGCATFRPTNVSTVREGPWVEVRTEHAVIHTNVDPQVAVKMGQELERLRRALLLLWGEDVNPPGQLPATHRLRGERRGCVGCLLPRG